MRRTLVALALCAASSAGCASAPAVAIPTAPAVAQRPATVPAERYRRLAWSPEMRSRDWIDEVYVPSVGVAFNLETESDHDSATPAFFPKLNAFFADGPVGYSEDLYGNVPVKPELTPIEISSEIAEAVREHAALVEALSKSSRRLGAMVDATDALPPVVGSPDWKPQEK